MLKVPYNAKAGAQHNLHEPLKVEQGVLNIMLDSLFFLTLLKIIRECIRLLKEAAIDCNSWTPWPFRYAGRI